jgi:phosphonoacetaldehyde hydrolase
MILSNPPSQFRGPLKAVILDWAGTVIDFGSCAPVEAFLRLFAARGVSLSPEEARRPMGVDKRTHLRQLVSIPAVARRWRRRCGREPDEADLDALYREFLPLQLEVIRQRAAPVPGALEALAGLRGRGLKIGSTTGYSREVMEALVPEAARLGFNPGSIVCASDAPAGRPEPWMALLSAQQLRVFPMAAVLKVGDTLPDIAEGLNAGMWAAGVSLTGNELGLDEAAFKLLPPDELEARQAEITARMLQAGAHYVIDGLWDLPRVVDEINLRLANGERP